MATPRQIDRQIALETQMVEDGIAQLQANIRKAEERSYASSTVYAQKLLKEAIPEVAAEIKEIRTNRLLRGKAGAALAPLVKYTMTIDDNVVAMIVLKVLFDCASSPKDKADNTVKVIDKIGTAIEAEAKWRWFKDQDPDLLRRISHHHHAGKGYHYKDYDMTRRFSQEEHKWERWPATARTKIGNAFADAACRSTGWWKRETQHDKDKRSHKVRTTSKLTPTEELVRLVDALKDQAELFAPLNWPMLVEPNDWTNETPGGYLTNQVRRGNDLIRMFGPSPLQGEKPLEFLNHLQKVAYRINHFILDVAQRLENDSYPVKDGKFIPEDRWPMPVKPHDIDTNKEAREAYRKEATKVHDHNSTAAKTCIRTKLTMSMARKFAKEERYYLPWSYDYRGRVYPIPAFLTPQDTCFGKSLIQFADGEPLTERGLYWLRFQLATTYGLDKATMEERQAWAQSKEALTIIKRIATDPIGNISDWESTDEPFLFLAAAEELYALTIACTRHTTHLPVAVDATCSGLQVLAGLSHDGSTAELVNVKPGAKPSDAYKAVANRVNPKLPAEWGIQLTRSDVKRVVMTIPYNAKTFSNRSYIRDELTERKVEVTKEQLTKITALTREAMREIVPGPLNVMDWLNTEIGRAIKNGADHISWETPSGFVVKQDLRKTKTERIDANLMGRIQLKIGVGFGDPDLNHHKNAGAPNLIHSMDASILQLGLRQFGVPSISTRRDYDGLETNTGHNYYKGHPFTVIHDSVLCGANHMDEMQAAVRDAYVEIFLHHSPLHDFAEAIGAETPPPMEYTFDPETVKESTYFFC